MLIFLYNFIDNFDCALALKDSTGLALLVVYGMLPVTSGTIFSTLGCEDFDDGSSLLRTGETMQTRDKKTRSP